MKLSSNMLMSGIVALLLLVSGWYVAPYVYYWMAQQYTEQEAIAYLQRQIMSFRSLNFATSSELITMLKNHEQALKNEYIHDKEMQFQDTKKRDALRIANKKMLQEYVKDLQGYTKIGMPTTSSVVQFSYDTVVRLTIALAELEKDHGTLPSDEYVKRVDRMHEIIERSIIHGKRTLRSYLQAGLKEDDTKVQSAREHITRKVEHFIELNKILYL